jgi:hypothetical protein
MAINPYYVGSSLDTIGNNMSRDYATDAGLRAAELQARNQFAQILQQALQAQANRQQQGDQFNQELAYRNAALAQSGNLRGQELSQNQGQFDSNLNYMREALKQQLASQLELGKMQFPPERWTQPDPRAIAAQIEQQGRNVRDEAVLNQEIEQHNLNAQSTANRYNELLKSLAKEKDGWFTFESTAKQQAWNQLLNSLNSNAGEAILIQPETVEQNGKVQHRFKPILRDKVKLNQPQPSQQPGGAGGGGLGQILNLIQRLISSGGQATPSQPPAASSAALIAEAKRAIALGADPTAVNARLGSLAPQTQTTNTATPPYPASAVSGLLDSIRGSSTAVYPPLPQQPAITRGGVMPMPGYSGLPADPNQLNMQSLIQALNNYAGR